MIIAMSIIAMILMILMAIIPMISVSYSMNYDIYSGIDMIQHEYHTARVVSGSSIYSISYSLIIAIISWHKRYMVRPASGVSHSYATIHVHDHMTKKLEVLIFSTASSMHLTSPINPCGFQCVLTETSISSLLVVGKVRS